MRNLALFSIISLLLVSQTAFAKTFAVPSKGEQIASVNLPDAWKPEPYELGVKATSPDGRVFWEFEAVDGNDVAAATENGMKYFLDQGVVVDEKTIRQNEGQVNGMKAFDMSFQGTDKIGPAKLGMTVVATNKPDKFVIMLYWGDAEGEKANAKDISAIAQSIKPTQ